MIKMSTSDPKDRCCRQRPWNQDKMTHQTMVLKLLCTIDNIVLTWQPHWRHISHYWGGCHIAWTWLLWLRSYSSTCISLPSHPPLHHQLFLRVSSPLASMGPPTPLVWWPPPSYISAYTSTTTIACVSPCLPPSQLQKGLLDRFSRPPIRKRKIHS